MTNRAYQELLKRHYAVYDQMITNVFEEIELMTCLFGGKIALSTVDVDYTWKELLEYMKDTYQTWCEERKEKISEEEKTIEHNEWIPCSERLPEEGNTTYMTTLDYGELGRATGQRFFYGKDIGWEDDAVVAWMPFPKPYKESK